MAPQCLFAAIITCICHIVNLFCNKFNEDNSEQLGKVPGKETTSGQTYKVQWK